MKKCALLILILVFLVTGCTSNSFSSKDVSYFSEDLSRIPNHKLDMLLQQSYFSSGDIAGFNSVALANSKITLYSIIWILKLMELMNFDADSLTYLNELVDQSQRTDWELENIRTITNINRLVHVSAFKPDEFIKYLESHFDHKDNLFFWEKKNETFEEKLSATVVAISALKYIDPKSIMLQKVKSKFISLYSDDSFFESFEVSDGILNYGGVIILGLKELDITPTNLPQAINLKRKESVSRISEKVTSIMNYDFLSILTIYNLVQLNQFFELQIDIEPYLSSMFSEKSSFSDLYLNNQLVADPQYLYIILQLCLYSRYEFPFKTELHDYINNSVTTRFTSTLNPILKVDDNYFGLYLSESSGFKYDKTKVNQLISTWHRVLMEENISIKDSDKLKNIYFLTKSAKLLNVVFNENKQLPKSIGMYLDSILLSENNTNDVQKILDISLGIELLNELKVDLDNNLRKKIVSFIKDKIQAEQSQNEIIQSIYVCDVYKIMYLLGTNNFEKNDLSKVYNAIENLYVSGGFKNNTRPNGEPDLFSTLKGVKTLSLMSNLDEKRKKEVNQFLSSVYDNELLYTISPRNKTTDLRTISAGINVEQLIGGI